MGLIYEYGTQLYRVSGIDLVTPYQSAFYVSCIVNKYLQVKEDPAQLGL